MIESKEITLHTNSTPVEDNNDRSNDEQYFAEHPIATGQPTMRCWGFFNANGGPAHETGAITLSQSSIDIEDNNDRSNDEQYFAEHPIATGQPTMRLK